MDSRTLTIREIVEKPPLDYARANLAVRPGLRPPLFPSLPSRRQFRPPLPRA